MKLLQLEVENKIKTGTITKITRLRKKKRDSDNSEPDKGKSHL